MNEIVTKFWLAEDKLMSEMHLKQPGSTYIARGPLTKNKERIRKFIQTGDTMSTKIIFIRFDFSMIWFMEILKI